MKSVRIGSIFEAAESDYEQPPVLTWKDFYGFRNHVLRILRRFGSAGPMGEVDLSVEDEDDAPAFESDIVKNPDFFVVDDMYNGHDRLSLVECDPVHLRLDLLEALVEMMCDFPEWAVKFSLGDSAILVGSEAILVGGRRFWDMTLAEQVAERCAKPVEYGDPPPLDDSMYRLWLLMIRNEFKPSIPYSDLSDRQWIEAVHTLRNVADKRGDKGLLSFDYDVVRYDLHPETRRQLILRLLAEIRESDVVLPSRIRNVEKDAADALLNSSAEMDQEYVARQISLAQRALRQGKGIKDVALWWPNIIHHARNADAALRRSMVRELFSLAVDPDPVIRISGIFGLALLRIEGLASLIDESVKTFPDWAANEPLMKWLGRLKAGSSSYPDGAVFERWNKATTLH